MAEEKNVRQLILEKAKACHLDDSVVNGILRLAEGENQKLADLLKIFDFLQDLETKDAAYGPPIVLDVDVEDMSRYTDAELRTMQAQLEWYLNGGADGDETKEQPSIAAPPDKPLSASNAPETSGGREAERKPPRKIDLKLEDYLHG